MTDDLALPVLEKRPAEAGRVYRPKTRTTTIDDGPMRQPGWRRSTGREMRPISRDM